MKTDKGLNKGDDAPEFVLKDQFGKEFRLSDFKGKFVLLSFQSFCYQEVYLQGLQLFEKFHPD